MSLELRVDAQSIQNTKSVKHSGNIDERTESWKWVRKQKNGFREKKGIVIKSLEYKQMSGNVHPQRNSIPKVMLPS